MARLQSVYIGRDHTEPSIRYGIKCRVDDPDEVFLCLFAFGKVIEDAEKKSKPDYVDMLVLELYVPAEAINLSVTNADGTDEHKKVPLTGLSSMKITLQIPSLFTIGDKGLMIDNEYSKIELSMIDQGNEEMSSVESISEPERSKRIETILAIPEEERTPEQTAALFRDVTDQYIEHHTVDDYMLMVQHFITGIEYEIVAEPSDDTADKPKRPRRRIQRALTKADIEQKLHTDPARSTLIRAVGAPGKWAKEPESDTSVYTHKMKKNTYQVIVDPNEQHDVANTNNGSIIRRGNAANSRAMMYILDRLDAEQPIKTGEYQGVDIHPLVAARAIGRLDRVRGNLTKEVTQTILDAAILGAGVTVCKKLNNVGKNGSVSSVIVPVWTIDHIKKKDDEIEYIRVRMSGEFRGLVIQELKPMIGKGELLNELPTGKPGGAWAEVTALYLMDFWRREANQKRSREVKLTRRELLTTIKPEAGDVEAMLKGRKHAERPAIYWADALKELARIGFIADDQDTEYQAAQDFKATGKVVPIGWLDEEVLIRPGRIMTDEIASVKRIEQSQNNLKTKLS